MAQPSHLPLQAAVTWLGATCFMALMADEGSAPASSSRLAMPAEEQDRLVQPIQLLSHATEPSSESPMLPPPPRHQDRDGGWFAVWNGAYCPAASKETSADRDDLLAGAIGFLCNGGEIY
jgi:hypothetical protein